MDSRKKRTELYMLVYGHATCSLGRAGSGVDHEEWGHRGGVDPGSGVDLGEWGQVSGVDPGE